LGHAAIQSQRFRLEVENPDACSLPRG
jgi:hypothetical protein